MTTRTRNQILFDTLGSLLEKGVAADVAFAETTWVFEHPDCVTVKDFDEQIVCDHNTRAYKNGLALCPSCGYLTVYNELPLRTTD